MQDDLPKYGAKSDWGWVFLVLLGVQVLLRLVIHFRNPFDIPVCDRNSLAVDFVTDPLIWVWAVLAIIFRSIENCSNSTLIILGYDISDCGFYSEFISYHLIKNTF